ncbi:hypothetical protein [Curtobacterium sp. NPDC089185]|uniref:hypothetical protein n=1 Tax=Curtobacterium sp. NPDC089185 TaxID=3154968 RepID=UPI003424DA44
MRTPSLRRLAAITCAALALVLVSPATGASAVPEASSEQLFDAATGARTSPDHHVQPREFAFAQTPSGVSVRSAASGYYVFAKPQCTGACWNVKSLIDRDGERIADRVDTTGGYFVPWPASWAEGQTRDAGTVYSSVYDGLWWYWNSNKGVRLGNVTRPYETAPLRINSTGKNDAARTMTVAGQATKHASIRLQGGGELATADAKGLWSATIGGLSLGSNTRTIQQYVGGQFVDEQSATVTIVDPVKTDQIVGETGTAELTRGGTSDVSVTYTAKSAFTTPNGRLTVQAPAGTAFAPGQDQQRGEYLDGDTWRTFGGNSIVGGERSPDGTRYEYQLGNRNWNVAAGQQFRFTFRVETPADVATTSGAMTGTLAGSFTNATFDTTARTTTTVVGRPFTAAVRFSEDVTQRATLSGTGQAGSTVSIGGAWFVPQPVTVASDGTWSVTIPAPDASGAKTLTVTQTTSGQPTGSVEVPVDYGNGVRIYSPADGFQITPVWDTVRVSGTAEPGARVSLGEDGDADRYGTVTADADGRWAITTTPLTIEDHRLVATALSKGANTTTDRVLVVSTS